MPKLPRKTGAQLWTNPIPIVIGLSLNLTRRWNSEFLRFTSVSMTFLRPINRPLSHTIPHTIIYTLFWRTIYGFQGNDFSGLFFSFILFYEDD
jgi:hypothetical protein